MLPLGVTPFELLFASNVWVQKYHKSKQMSQPEITLLAFSRDKINWTAYLKKKTE